MSMNAALRQHMKPDRMKRALKGAARRVAPAKPALGNDGLTDGERFESLVRYRATVGSKPADTPEHRARMEVVREKLEPVSLDSLIKH